MVSLVILASALLLFCLSLLTVVRVPHGALWKPALAALEWGHVVSVPALLLCAVAVSRICHVESCGGIANVLAAGASGAAVALFWTPTMRAVRMARQVRVRARAALGEVVPPSSTEAPARGAPFRLRDLLGYRSGRARAEVVRHTYRVTEGEGGAGEMTLDLYGTTSGSPQPLVVSIHGGSWNSGDASQLPAINHYLALRGYRVAAITYRLAPEHCFPIQRDDIVRAIDWLRDQGETLGIDPTRVALLGRSAGAHLALDAGCALNDGRAPSSWGAIRSVVAYYPPSDLNWSWANPTNPRVLDTFGTIGAFMGGSPQERGAAFDEASPYNHIGSSSPATLLMHGGRDELVFAEQSRRLARRLEADGVTHVSVELPWATHGFDANRFGPGGQISTWLVERFLAHTLLPAGGQ